MTVETGPQCRQPDVQLFPPADSPDSRSRRLLFRLYLLRAAKSAQRAAKRHRRAGRHELAAHQRSVALQLLASADRLA